MSQQNVNNERAELPVMATLEYGEKAFRFLLPSSRDHISKTIISGSFYEAALLAILRKFLEPGDLVVDVGANIGNHTVFFAGVCGCHVEAFEPNEEAAFFLKESVRLNLLDASVTIHGIALSNEESRLSINAMLPGNLGATSFKVDDQGSVRSMTLDSYKFGKKVALIKIDAEGMDALVVAGARRLIQVDRPIVVCEAADSAAFDRISDALSGDDYIAVGCFNATDTYIFTPSKTASERAVVARFEASGLLSVQHGLKALGERFNTSKRALDKIALQQRQLSAAVYGEEGPANNGTPLSDRIEKLTDNSVGLANTLSGLRDKLELQQASLLNSLGQLGTVAFSAGEVSTRLSHFSGDLVRIENSTAVANARADAAESLGRDTLQAVEQFHKRLQEGLASSVTQHDAFEERLSSLKIGLAELDARLSGDMRQLRAALDSSEQESIKRTSYLRTVIDSQQLKEFQKIQSEQSRIVKSVEAAQVSVGQVDQRFNALMNGRIFSTLRSLKRFARVIMHPFPRSAGLASKRLEDAESGRVAEAGAGQASRLVPPSALVSVVPAVVDSTSGRFSALATRTRAPAIGNASHAVTEKERAEFQPRVVSLLAAAPAYTSRKVSVADLAFLQRQLPQDGLVSIIMTTYNTRDYVEAAVNSILLQTYPNIELIVVDDGSSDGTREAVESIAKRDPRVRCISFGVNRGTYWCKNYGITRAKGVAITFMDSDDTSEPTRIAKQYETLATRGCAVSTCLHERRDLQGNLITVAGRTRRVAYISQMMRKGVFELLGYFDSVRTSADDEMLRRIKRFIGADSHKTVHEVLYHAVVRDSSLTQDPTNRGISAVAGVLSEPRKAYSDAVDLWHEGLQKRGRSPYMPFPLARRPFPVHDRLLVAPGHFNGDIISVCIASFPAREKQLRLAFNSLIEQVDLLFVYLNQYDAPPEFLKHPRVIVKSGGEDLRDNGKFYFTPEVPDGYCFTVDDDIIYPPDYAQTLIRKIELYGRKVCVGLHGTVFARPFVSYFEGRRVMHFRQSLDRDHVVDQLGTGTLAFHTSLWRPSSQNFTTTGMVDAWVAVEARRRDIPLVAVERRKAWLSPIPIPDDAPPSLFEEFKSSADRQTNLIAGCNGWGVGVGGDAKEYIDAAVRSFGSGYESQVCALEMIEAAHDGAAAAPAAAVSRELFKLAVVGRTNKERWKKGGILKSTHLTADMLRPLGVEVALIDLEIDDPRSLGEFDADIVMIYPGDPERPDFKDVISLVDHHALLGRAVLVNLSLNGRPERKQYICEQMALWRALYGKRVGLMVFGDRVEDDPALASIIDTIVAIPKTLEYDNIESRPFAEREGIFLGDYGKLCDESLLAWPADEAIDALRRSVPDAHLFCVEQYRPKYKRNLGLEVLPFLESEYARVLSRSKLMVSLVKYATFEMVPMELSAMGVPVLHPKMDNSLSDYLGLGAIEIQSVEHLAHCAKALYSDPEVWKGVSNAGRLVARGLAWENMAAQMYLRLLNFRRSALC